MGLRRRETGNHQVYTGFSWVSKRYEEPASNQEFTLKEIDVLGRVVLSDGTSINVYRDGQKFRLQGYNKPTQLFANLHEIVHFLQANGLELQNFIYPSENIQFLVK